jgi:hypothetical protein
MERDSRSVGQGKGALEELVRERIRGIETTAAREGNPFHHTSPKWPGSAAILPALVILRLATWSYHSFVECFGRARPHLPPGLEKAKAAPRVQRHELRGCHGGIDL